METGTGKTFTYLQTIFEIHKHFGKNHFIIVLPRVAIKQGVLQTIRHTKRHFYKQYKKYIDVIDLQQSAKDKRKYVATHIHHYLNYDNKIKVIVTTNSTFNKKDNIINDILQQGELGIRGTFWDNIISKNPVVVIDEPHLLKGEKTTAYLNKLSNSLFIRFGATFPTDKDHALSNVVYALDSYQAFSQHLVKGITVHTILTHGDSYKIKPLATSTKTKKGRAKIYYFKDNISYTKTIYTGDVIDIGIPSIDGTTIARINTTGIHLSNGQTITDTTPSMDDTEIELSIQKTIDVHFAKEQILFDKGIKTLSLFFIANIGDYRGDTPRIKNIFERLYKQKRTEILHATGLSDAYKQYLQSDITAAGELTVSQGYFSGDKGNADDREKASIDAILNDKQALLSLHGDLSNLRFIFSVWALQEGWDNPNVFTICKLAPTDRETSLRQQVGRGLRVAVDKHGNRLTHDRLQDTFYDINTLDMVVSHHETDFIQTLQQEIQDASSQFVSTETCTLDDLRTLGLDDTASAVVYAALSRNNIINTEGGILSPITEFLKNTPIPMLSDADKQKIIDAYDKKRLPVTSGNTPNEKVTIRPAKYAQFKQLWEKINTQAKIVYRGFTDDVIINDIAQRFNKLTIAPKQITITTEKYNIEKNIIEPVSENSIGSHTYFKTADYHDFIEHISQMFHMDTCKHIPIDFVIKLFNKLNKTHIANDPQRAKRELKTIITAVLHDSMFQHIEYNFCENTFCGGNVLENAEIEASKLGRFKAPDDPVHENLLYDKIIYDSTPERLVQRQGFEPHHYGTGHITVFAKLPEINIPTPFKEYNPDFAYLVHREDGKKALFLVVETKGYENESDIPQIERQKIDYAKKFFHALDKKLQRDNIDIRFKTRINKQKLSEILNDFIQ